MQRIEENAPAVVELYKVYKDLKSFDIHNKPKPRNFL